jgi:hypothetical protein
VIAASLEPPSRLRHQDKKVGWQNKPAAWPQWRTLCSQQIWDDAT